MLSGVVHNTHKFGHFAKGTFIKAYRVLETEQSIIALLRRKRGRNLIWNAKLSGAMMAIAIVTIVWIDRPEFAGKGVEAMNELTDTIPATVVDTTLLPYLEAYCKITGSSATHQVLFDGLGF